MELQHYISNYFGGLSAQEAAKVGSFFVEDTIPKGEFMLKTGRRCERMCFIRSGFLRIFVEEADREVTQWVSTSGYFSTDLASFMFDTPARWNIQALTDTEVYSISKTQYNSIKTIVPRWPELEKMFLIRCFTILEDRIYTHLSMSAEERYRFFFEHNRQLFNQVPLQYIASMLGMTPETFSRIRKKQLL